MLSYNVELDGKTVLVTGAAGFIGSNLVMRLFHDFRNIRVIGVDSITDYYDVNIKYERLKEIELLNRDWTFVHASIADKDAVERIFSEDRISVVVNLAAQAGVRYSITNPDAYVQVILSVSIISLKPAVIMRWSTWFMLLHHPYTAVTRQFRIQLMTRLTTRSAFMQQQKRVTS
jgi:dTDP-D-glucose 4,6-dehydratase